MRPTTVLAATFLAAFIIGAAPASGDVLIKVDKSSQRMSVFVDGEKRYSWPVSTGLSGYSTPRGSFTPFRLEEDHFSKEWDDAPMPHSIFFTPRGHAIHGSDATSRLGSPASHGCIRLSRPNAATLFELVAREGLRATKIQVGGQETTATARKRSRTRYVEEGRPQGRSSAQRAARRSHWEEIPQGSDYYEPSRTIYAPQRYYGLPGRY